MTLHTALGEVGRLLDGLSIRWVLAGGLAANRCRRSPRHTDDVDPLLADAGPGLDTLESTLAAAGWTVHRADPRGELLRARHSDLGPVDLLIPGTTYQREALRRALVEVETVPGAGAVPVLSVEDVILHKLIAGRYRDLAKGHLFDGRQGHLHPQSTPSATPAPPSGPPAVPWRPSTPGSTRTKATHHPT